MSELVGTHEIAEMLGVTRQRVHQLVHMQDFPTPVAVLSAGSIWNRAEVAAWAEQHGRDVIDGDPT